MSVMSGSQFCNNDVSLAASKHVISGLPHRVGSQTHQL